jgi:hypothetical protein
VEAPQGSEYRCSTLGGDWPVVAMKLSKGSGAKGSSYPFYYLVNQ